VPRTITSRLALAFAAVAFAAIAALSAVALDRSLRDDVAETDAEVVIPRDPPVIFEPLPDGYRIENVLSGLSAPAAFDAAPDGRIFVAEQYSGMVQVIESGALRGDPFYTVPDLYTQTDPGFVSELGLVGVTVNPDVSEGTFVYIYYSAQSPTGRITKLVRLRDDGGVGVEPVTLLEVEGAPECCHIAGALTWMPDGTLLVGVGDHEVHDDAQELASLRGKILRIDRDGNPPDDNPFAGRDDADPRVYAYGLRNAFGVAVAPDGSDMFVLDNGEFGFDTIHRLEPGANYGWPSSAIDDPSQVTRPLLTYLESTGLAGAIAYASGPLREFEGKLLFCQFHRGGALHAFNPRPARLEADDVVLASGCSSGIRQLPDGYVYFLDYLNGALIRIVDGAAPAFGAPEPIP
jgi:glucose/arabinose dehydrogenase